MAEASASSGPDAVSGQDENVEHDPSSESNGAVEASEEEDEEKAVGNQQVEGDASTTEGDAARTEDAQEAKQGENITEEEDNTGKDDSSAQTAADMDNETSNAMKDAATEESGKADGSRDVIEQAAQEDAAQGDGLEQQPAEIEAAGPAGAPVQEESGQTAAEETQAFEQASAESIPEGGEGPAGGGFSGASGETNTIAEERFEGVADNEPPITNPLEDTKDDDIRSEMTSKIDGFFENVKAMFNCDSMTFEDVFNTASDAFAGYLEGHYGSQLELVGKVVDFANDVMSAINTGEDLGGLMAEQLPDILADILRAITPDCVTIAQDLLERVLPPQMMNEMDNNLAYDSLDINPQDPLDAGFEAAPAPDMESIPQESVDQAALSMQDTREAAVNAYGQEMEPAPTDIDMGIDMNSLPNSGENALYYDYGENNVDSIPQDGNNTVTRPENELPDSGPNDHSRDMVSQNLTNPDVNKELVEKTAEAGAGAVDAEAVLALL